jgi:excisionase family DNA binding protein
MNEPQHDPLLDLTEAGRLLGLSRTTIRRWVDDGRLAHYVVSESGRRRVLRSDLLLFRESLKVPPEVLSNFGTSAQQRK